MTTVWPAPDPITIAGTALGPEAVVGGRCRVHGVDLARALAFAGMLVAHFMARHTDHPVPDAVRAFVDGRAMPLFVLLSGVSITLLAGHARHPDRALLVRAAVFLPLGLALQEWAVQIAIILQYYALFSLVAVGLRRLGDRALLAGAVLVAGAAGVTAQELAPRWPSYPGWQGGDGIRPPWGLLANLTVNGYYPLLPALAFVLVGMWLGRRNLDDARLAARLALVGVVLGLVGYVGGRAAGDRLGLDGVTTGADGLPALRAEWVGPVLATMGPDATLADVDDVLRDDPAARRAQLEVMVRYARERQPGFHLVRLLDAHGHSQMPAWVAGSTGTACAALGGCVLLARRFRRTAAPLVALGQCSLTVYVVQAVVIRWTPSLDETTMGRQALITGAMLAGCTAFSWAWRRWFRRGPLEGLLHLLARP